MGELVKAMTNLPSHQFGNCELPAMRPDPNVLLRTEPCRDCGGMMLWTQNAWAQGDNRAAAYRCANGHVIDPADTHQCPECGVHDTSPVAAKHAGAYQCQRCGHAFTLGA